MGLVEYFAPQNSGIHYRSNTPFFGGGRFPITAPAPFKWLAALVFVMGLLSCGSAYAHEASQIPHGFQDSMPVDKDRQEIYNICYVNPRSSAVFVIQYRVYQIGPCSLSVRNVAEAVQIFLMVNGYEYSKGFATPENVLRRDFLILGGDVEYDAKGKDFVRNEGNIVIITKRDGEPWLKEDKKISAEMTTPEIIGLASYLVGGR